MADSTNSERKLFDTCYLSYIFVFWRQAQPTPSEIAAVHRADPRLKDMSVSHVTSLIGDEDWWRIGPLDSAAEADMIAAQLRKAGLRVEKKQQ